MKMSSLFYRIGKETRRSTLCSVCPKIKLRENLKRLETVLRVKIGHLVPDRRIEIDVNKYIYLRYYITISI